MRAKIRIMRQQGELRQPIGQERECELWLRHEKLPGEDRTVPVLRTIGDDRHAMYDPRVTYVTAGTIRFMGMEREGRAWHVQEWSCDLVYLEKVR